MLIPSIRERAAFSPDKFQGVPVARTSRSQTMLVCLEPEQAIPVHHPGIDLTLIVLEGRATLVSGDEALDDAGPGAVLHAEAGQARGIRARQRTLALVVVSPPSTEEDHREVFEHLKKGTWR